VAGGDEPGRAGQVQALGSLVVAEGVSYGFHGAARRVGIDGVEEAAGDVGAGQELDGVGRVIAEAPVIAS
jgi:hypothetical protein